MRLIEKNAKISTHQLSVMCHITGTPVILRERLYRLVCFHQLACSRGLVQLVRRPFTASSYCAYSLVCTMYVCVHVSLGHPQFLQMISARTQVADRPGGHCEDQLGVSTMD